MDKKVSTYHIIGGGIAGLCCAKFIKQKNPKTKIIIYEAAAHLGGRFFSYYDKELDRELNNATHCILGANKNAINLIKHPDWHSKPLFFDFANKSLSAKISRFKNHILLSIFNTNPENIAPKLIKKVFWKLFPFLNCKTRIYYSHNTSSSDIISPLTKYADEIKTGYKLSSYKAFDNQIKKLIFNHETVEIKQGDRIISALDAFNYNKLFGGFDFEYNEITNIFYRTSMAITLPENRPFIGVVNGICDWIFINKDILSVTISNSASLKINKDDLAREVWKEVRSVSGKNAAFVPPYKVVKYKRATIKHDEINQLKRPDSYKTTFSNLFLAGDWTYAPLPCCLESAVLSAYRLKNL